MAKKPKNNDNDSGDKTPPPPSSLPPPSPDDEPPLDDYGIDHDRLLELCEKMVEKLHDKYVIEEVTPANATEFREVAQTLESIWRLTKDILNLDDVINSAMSAIMGGQNFSGHDFEIELDEDQDEENPENEE